MPEPSKMNFMKQIALKMLLYDIRGVDELFGVVL